MPKKSDQKSQFLKPLSFGAFAFIYPLLSRATLSGELDKATAFATGTVMKTGIITTTVIGGITALAKGSPKYAGVIMGIGVAFIYFIGWVKGGTFEIST